MATGHDQWVSTASVPEEWTAQDSSHVGQVALLFVDGWLGVRFEDDLVVVDRDNEGRLREAEATLRPGGAAVAWTALCSCTWRGAPLSLGLFHRPGTTPSRRGRGPQVLAPVGVVGLLRSQWEEHTDPAVVLNAVRTAAAEYRRAGFALDAAVARARAVGLSWTEVGQATGMTRQSAHERWSKKPSQ